MTIYTFSFQRDEFGKETTDYKYLKKWIWGLQGLNLFFYECQHHLESCVVPSVFPSTGLSSAEVGSSVDPSAACDDSTAAFDGRKAKMHNWAFQAQNPNKQTNKKQNTWNVQYISEQNVNLSTFVLQNKWAKFAKQNFDISLQEIQSIAWDYWMQINLITRKHYKRYFSWEYTDNALLRMHSALLRMKLHGQSHTNCPFCKQQYYHGRLISLRSIITLQNKWLLKICRRFANPDSKTCLSFLTDVNGISCLT